MNRPVNIQVRSELNARPRQAIGHRGLALVLCATVLLFPLLIPNRLAAHAGHDDVPEAAMAVIEDVPPRFYTHTDHFDAVLVFPSPKEDAVLYLTTEGEGIPVASAEIMSEVIVPEMRKLEVLPGEIVGSYEIKGLSPDTTHTVSVEVMAGDTMDFLTFDSVILTSPTATAADDSPQDLVAATVAGLPRYLVTALVAVVILAALANLLAVAIWVTRLVKSRGRVRNQNISRVLVLLSLSTLATLRLSAHAGDDHAGGDLAVSAVRTSGTAHFVAIQTQLQSEVRTTRVVESTLPLSFSTLGRVVARPDKEADVTPPAEGKLKLPPGENLRIPISGDTVEKGDVLAVLEPTIPAADLASLGSERSQVESELGEARQQLSLATSNAQRAERLTNVIAASEIEEAQTALGVARKRVEGLGNRLAGLNASLAGQDSTGRDIPIVAPISGTIMDSHATMGEFVQTDKKLFDIIDLSDVFVEAEIFEADIASIREATTAHITLEAYPGRVFVGQLQSLGQQVDPEKRTLRALFAVENPDEALRLGMFINVEIQTPGTEPVLMVPKAAVSIQDGVRIVYKKIYPETFVATPVHVTSFRSDMAVVGAGLAPGDRVAIKGLYQVRMSPVVGRGN